MNELFMNCRNSPDLSSRMRHQDSNFQIFQDAPGLSGTVWDSRLWQTCGHGLGKKDIVKKAHEKNTLRKIAVLIWQIDISLLA